MGAQRQRRGAQADGCAAESVQEPRETPPEAKNSPERVLTARDALRAVWDAMSERELQRAVVDGLRQRGYLVWHVVDSRLMAAGLPDVIAIHPTKLPRRVLFWELKREHGARLSAAQKKALAALGDVYGVDARVIRPSDWDAESEELP